MTVLERQRIGNKQKIVNAKKQTRRDKRLRVPVLPEEEVMIKAKASEAGLTIAEYLRSLA
ncbi:plasmid mobilization protein [Nitrosomonas sp.]|uniref:plasmid mobilization protein n=1 Tax=Nitrosomonas sp. TaxID=42353 RepID=UPI00284775D4|nr:hypothetical protein [Nitrosomonas sp.]MDR4515014.1 hypothetical protein [Nitrosomonas sp.]